MTAANIVDTLLETDPNPKELAMRAVEGPSLDAFVVFQCPFTNVGHGAPTPPVAKPNYYSDDFGDWQPDWSKASRYPLGEHIHNGVLDLNDLPFGTESVILVNPDGSPGKEYSISDLDLGTAEVVDTYDPPDGRDIEFGY